MSTNKTAIAWTDRTWNPLRGCSLVSPGCTNCYAMRVAHRFNGLGQPYEGLTRMTEHGPVWTGKVRMAATVDEPLHWKKPARIFVNSMSDLFHEGVPFNFVDHVLLTIAKTPRHSYQVLTKRPERMSQYFAQAQARASYLIWPLPNLWLGVSVENQATVDERISILLQTPAAVRFLSVEPLLEHIDLRSHLERTCVKCGGSASIPHPSGGGVACPRCLKHQASDPDQIDWVIVGGESGPAARPCNVDWVRSVVRQCEAADVSCFVKQLGANIFCSGITGPGEHWSAGGEAQQRMAVPVGDKILFPVVLKDRKGADPSEWPVDLRIQELPNA